MTQQLSNCCKAQVSVSSSDEGTSCFMCDGCKHPCDLEKITALNHGNCSCPICVPVKYQLNKTMKEQVSVCKIENLSDSDYRIGDNNLSGDIVVINKQKYERLKRLDENVNKLIAELKLIDGETTPSSLSKLLKGLYDE